MWVLFLRFDVFGVRFVVKLPILVPKPKILLVVWLGPIIWWYMVKAFQSRPGVGIHVGLSAWYYTMINPSIFSKLLQGGGHKPHGR